MQRSHSQNADRLTSRATSQSARFPSNITPIGTAIGLLLFACHAVAQNAAEAPASAASEADVQRLDQVVVRSRNRIEKVQDVPLSVSVVSGRDLERELALDIGAVTKRAANVERNSGNSRTYSCRCAASARSARPRRRTPASASSRTA